MRAPLVLDRSGIKIGTCIRRLLGRASKPRSTRSVPEPDVSTLYPTGPRADRSRAWLDATAAVTGVMRPREELAQGMVVRVAPAVNGRTRAGDERRSSGMFDELHDRKRSSPR
jgi:hypothetical protein